MCLESSKDIRFVYSVILGLHIVSGKNLDSYISDRSFLPWQCVHSRNITCGEIEAGLVYPTQTWTCADARVDGKRIAYGLYPGIGVDNRCIETRGVDELSEICICMMRTIGVSRPLWAAVVTSASCDFFDDERSYLEKNYYGFNWVDLGPGFGYIHTFKCMSDV